ncbi:glycosyltransferase family 4 protein [Methanosarcina vacuolata]|uniref:glycosyltransferase family 4 protein n=1 Tax=Methanosarcina vacuolata TaxID=2215 RepID=UPI0018DD1BCC|nr:glycosyltransferase family 4 protein [Methanosarcina vacuolata]
MTGDERIYGSTRAAYELTLNLAKRNHELSVFSTSDTLNDNIETRKNLNIYRYGSQLKLFSTHFSYSIFYKPQRCHLDIVHVHFDIPPVPFAGLKLSTETKTPLVVTYHGDWDDSYGSFFRKTGVRFFNRFFVDKLLTQADVIISPSENYIKESNFLVKYSDKTVVIPNGVNIEQFKTVISKEECRKLLHLPLNCKIILFLGALNLRKGPDILLNAMVNVIKEYPTSKLLYVGDGSFKSELFTMTKKLGLEDSVIFTGYIAENLKPLYYKASNLFVVPSTISTEVFPLVILEAMASNIPIIVSDLLTFKSIVDDGQNGLIARKSDPNDLSIKILQLLDYPNLVKKLCQNGLEYAEKYSWENVAKETEKVYKNYV